MQTEKPETQETRSEWEIKRDAEQAAKRAASDALYNGVAAHLPGWTVETREADDNYDFYSTWLTDGKGHRIDLEPITYGSERCKIRVSGHWPQSKPNSCYMVPSEVNEDSPSIKCSASKPHEAIAKDITRRFLPEYLRIWAKLQDKLDQRNAYASKQAANWARVCEASGVIKAHSKANGYHEETQAGDIRLGSKKDAKEYNYDAGYGDIRMSSSDTVEIKLHGVPVDRALAILKAIEESAPTPNNTRTKSRSGFSSPSEEGEGE